MLRNFKGWLFTALLVVVVAGCGAAKDGTNVTISDIGNVEGTITDATSGTPISGVTVQIGDKSNVTGNNGVYSIQDLAVGSRTVTAAKNGYQNYNGTVTVTKGTTVSHNIQITANGTTPDTTPPPVSPTTAIVISPSSMTVTDSNASASTKTSYFTIVVKDEQGNPVQNAELSISLPGAAPDPLGYAQLYDGSTPKNSPFTATTNAYGVYYLRVDYRSGGGTAYSITLEIRSGAFLASTTITVSGDGSTLTGGSMQEIPLILANTVSTFAGSAGSSGSTDGTGTAARFGGPGGMTTDGTNLYVADYSNSTIRKIVISTGAVTTIAGSAGATGSSDGIGTAARFNLPWGITTDGTNLYVADYQNSTIRKIVISTGAVTTIAGSAGVTGSTDGIGTLARFYWPFGITTDGSNLYVTDAFNKTVRKIVISTGAVTTIAGTAGSSGSTDGTGAAARFSVPYGITTDGTNLYVADYANHTIRKIVISTGDVTTIAGSAGSSGATDDTGTTARFSLPTGITTDGTNLFVTDYGNMTVRKVVISTGAVTTIAGSAGSIGSTDGAGTSARFSKVGGITTDGAKLFVSDLTGPTIRKIQ